MLPQAAFYKGSVLQARVNGLEVVAPSPPALLGTFATCS